MQCMPIVLVAAGGEACTLPRDTGMCLSAFFLGRSPAKALRNAVGLHCAPTKWHAKIPQARNNTNPMPPTLFISDLHLAEHTPKLRELFRHFMTQIAPQGKALYILGDFFDLWYSDLQSAPWITEVQTLLQQLTAAGVPTYLMVGNRDFMLGHRFAQHTTCVLLPDPSTIPIGPHRVVLCHGDTLCTDDKSYQRYRRFIRHPATRWIAEHLPCWAVSLIGHSIRRRSASKHAKRREKKNTAIADVNASAASALCSTHQGTHLLHGHTHVAGVHPLPLTHTTATRLVLNAWDTHGHYLQWDDDGGFAFKCFG